jgi:hypothetical protein
MDNGYPRACSHTRRGARLSGWGRSGWQGASQRAVAPRGAPWPPRCPGGGNGRQDLEGGAPRRRMVRTVDDGAFLCQRWRMAAEAARSGGAVSAWERRWRRRGKEGRRRPCWRDWDPDSREREQTDGVNLIVLLPHHVLSLHPQFLFWWGSYILD